MFDLGTGYVIPMKMLFENTPSVHLTVYRGNIGQLEPVMLRMRSGLHLFDCIWLYILRQ